MTLTISYTTRKLAKTDEITDENFSSVIFTDENNFIFNFISIHRQITSIGITVVYTDKIHPSVYIDSIADRLYRFLKSYNGVMT